MIPNTIPSPPFPGAVLIETHAHTAEVSACSALTAKKLVELVIHHGYGALVVTDHCLPGQADTRKQREAAAQGYLLALEAGARSGLVVLPGLELRLDGEGFHHFLVYFPDPALFTRLPDLTAMSPRALRLLADQEGFLIYQAHPYRDGLHPIQPDCLHGMEAWNGNPHHESHNELAYAFAQQHGLAMISGSDLHEVYGAGLGGIWAPPGAIASPEAFVAYLRATLKPSMLCPGQAS